MDPPIRIRFIFIITDSFAVLAKQFERCNGFLTFSNNSFSAANDTVLQRDSKVKSSYGIAHEKYT